MKSLHKLCLTLLLGLSLAATAPRLCAQQPQSSSNYIQNGKSAEVDSENQQYTHSAVVQAIARHLHVSVDTAAGIFEDFNSGIVIVTIAYFLWKFVPGVLRRRSQLIRKGIEDAQSATEDANRRLAQVEARLSRLDAEIDAMRHQVETEAAEEEKRILAGMEAERARIVASAEQEIAAAQSAAERELRKFAANLAVDHALERIQLTSDADRALVRDFGKHLNHSGGEA